MAVAAEQEHAVGTAPHASLADKRVLAVLSPNNWNNLMGIEQGLRSVFPQLQVECPNDLTELERIVRASHGEADLVIAVGGDGTVHRMLQHIDLQTQALGLLPGGTGNDLARTLGYPAGNMTASLNYMHTLTLKPIDLCMVNGIRYHNSGGFGLDAATLKYRDAEHGLLKKQYNLAFVCALFGMAPLDLEVHYGDKTERGSFFWALGMNNRDIGKGTRIAPNARIDDGLLDMVLVRRVSKLRMLQLLPRAVRGEHLDDDAVVHAQVRSFRCESLMPVEVLACDGELHNCGRTTVEFEVVPQGLTLLR